MFFFSLENLISDWWIQSASIAVGVQKDETLCEILFVVIPVSRIRVLRVVPDKSLATVLYDSIVFRFGFFFDSAKPFDFCISV